MTILVHKSISKPRAISIVNSYATGRKLPQDIAINIVDDTYVIEPINLEDINLFGDESNPDYYKLK